MSQSIIHAVIGTAGHVDHGKSLLIQSLTGKNPTRLPEEQARGMTIDLGFSHFSTTNGDMIGVIDVPGHERFLRNMVSSVWGLDLILFVVAADEGWSPLSEEHLRVLTALNCYHCIAVINKCDLVDDRQIADVEEVILDRFLTLTNTLPTVIKVSAHTGWGIESLKQTIITTLQTQPTKQELVNSSHIYIDRHFSVNGIGTTITGTLRGAALSIEQTLMLYPGGYPIRLRSMQSYHRDKKQVNQCSRIALGLKQVKRNLIKRGSCLVEKDVNVYVTKDWLINLNDQFTRLKKNSEVEVAIGTGHSLAKCYLLADGKIARLQLRDELVAFWGQPLLLLAPGGGRIIGAGKLLWANSLKRGQQQRILNYADLLLNASYHDIELIIHGYTSHSHSDLPNISKHNQWLVDNLFEQTLSQRITQYLTHHPHIVPIDHLLTLTQIPMTLLIAIIEHKCKTQCWRKTEEGVTLFERQTIQLTHEQHRLYEEIEQCGNQFFNAYQQQRPLLQKQLQILVKYKLIIPMEYNLYVAHQHYQTLLAGIMNHRTVGEQFSIADARERIGLSRKLLIPLLNRIERDGWIKRVGDLREIRKIVIEEQPLNDDNTIN